jgi:hypothetical protein
MGKINSKKVVYNDIEFDSKTEGEYYQYLINNQEGLGIQKIMLQHSFELIPGFNVDCLECRKGMVKSPKTGKLIQCKKCKGEGVNKRQSWTYTADFVIFYKDKQSEVIDVKGFANERFPLVKKMFEWKYGKRLIVVEKSKKGWVRK